jgi:adenylate cyclase
MKLTRRARRLLGLPTGLLLAALVLAIASSSLMLRFEALSHDARWRLIGERPLAPRIVIVDVNDETLSLLGWPIPRGFYAQLIEVARKHGARAVGFDVLFFEASTEENDALLAKAARDCACVIFPSQLSPIPAAEGGGMRVERPIDVLAAASAGVAHVQLDNSIDGVYRRAPLDLEGEGVTHPPLAVALARVGGAPVAALRPDEDGLAWLSWRAARASTVRALTLLEVLGAEDALTSGEEPDIDLDERFRGALVLVGQSAKSVGDRGPLPMSADAPLLLAHANLLDNLIEDRALEPPPFGIVALFVLLFGAVTGTAVTALRAVAGLAVAALAVVGLWVLATVAFAQDIWLPLAAPTLTAALTLVAAAMVNVWGRDADERKLRQAFERYVAPHILDKILQGAEGVDIRGHRRTLTLLFSDIKGYTTLSNTLQPDQIVELLCTYLDTMVDILLKREGTVDKIMGDGIMAFFGDPLPQEDHALRCIQAALDMQRATTQLGEKWIARGLSPLQVRIGIATGEVFVGSIGSRQHLEYTAIGRPVNLAARLEGKAPPGGVLVSKETWELVKDEVEAREVRGLDLKGYSAGYDAWLVTGLKGAPSEREAGRAEQRTSARQLYFSDVSLAFSGVQLEARSSDISPGGMFIQCDVLPPKGAQVHVRATLSAPLRGAIAVSMDAVVTHVREGKPGTSGVGLMFVTVFADDRDAIQVLLDGVLGRDRFEEARLVENDGAGESGDAPGGGPGAREPRRFAYPLHPGLAGDAAKDADADAPDHEEV